MPECTILLVLVVVPVLEIPCKIEDEDENDDEDEPKPWVFHTGSAGGTPNVAVPDYANFSFQTPAMDYLQRMKRLAVSPYPDIAESFFLGSPGYAQHAITHCH